MGNEQLNIVVRLQDEASKQLTALQSKFGSLTKMIEPAVGASQAFAVGLLGAGVAVGGFAVSAVKAAGDMEALTKGMVAVSGSSEKAQENIAKLKEVAKLPGLGFREAIQGSINLQAAGLSAEKSQRALKAFGNALATVGKGRAELDGVVLALQQISSKGIVSAEEINQLNERLPQIRKAMQDAFGTADTEALKKMGIRSDVFIEEIIKQFEKLPPVANSFNNSVENLQDTWNQFLVGEGAKLLVWAQSLVDSLSYIITNVLPPFIAAISGMIDFLSQNKEMLWIVAGAIVGGLVPAIYAAVTAFAALAIALAPFIIGGIIIGAAIAGILLVAKNWDYVVMQIKAAGELLALYWNQLWTGIGNMIKSVWQSIKDSVAEGANWIIEKVNTVINALNRVSSFSAGVFGKSGASMQISNIPMFAEGGIVNSPTIGMIGEAGPEAVIPLSKMGSMGGTTVVINNPEFRSRDDEDRLKRMLDQYFRPLLINNKI